MSGRTIGDGLNELSAGLALGAAFAAFCLACAQCSVGGQQANARRYEACLRYTKSLEQCGKP